MGRPPDMLVGDSERGLHLKNLGLNWERQEPFLSLQQGTHLGKKGRLSERYEQSAQSLGKLHCILDAKALRK